MADKTEAAPAKSDKDKLVEKAEALLQAVVGYNRADEYNRGVQAVIDLLKKSK